MKKAIVLALLAMASASVYAEDAVQKNPVTTPAKVAAPVAAPAAKEAVAVKLSADEQAFAAKLNEKNRLAFSGKLSAEQRQAVMVAVKNGANADEAVQHLLVAQEVKAAPEASAEKTK